MPCVLTQAIGLGCRDAVGGIKEALIVEKSAVANITSTGGVISAMTMNSTKKFFRYSQEIEKANFKEVMQTSDTNFTKFYEQTLSLSIFKPTASQKLEFELLASTRLAVIILDGNGVYWYLGEVNGMSVQPSELNSGTAFGDANVLTLLFKGMEKSFAKEVTSSIIAGITT